MGEIEAVDTRPEKKIAILGTTPSRMQGPIADDSGWEIWTIGPGGKDAHRWDRLFEIHGTWPWEFKDYLNDLSKVKAPQEVWTMQPMGPAIERWGKMHGKTPEEVAEAVTGDWAANKVFPRQAIMDKYFRRMWFSSSIAWLIPLAIEEGATDIGFWGIDLESGEEYVSQFVGCAHFMDLARLIGINIHTPSDSGLLRDPTPYPDRYETHLALTLEKKRKWLQQNIAGMEGQYESCKAEVHRKEGGLLTLKATEADPERLKKAEEALLQVNIRLGQLAANVNQLKGELAATEFYYRLYVTGLNEPQG